MIFDFGALPPEVNSARMYAGAGAGPMMAAATAFNRLAQELSTTAVACQAQLAQLTGDEWVGPSSTAMAAAAEPYVMWMHTTAGQLEHAGVQAMASAAAYQAAQNIGQASAGSAGRRSPGRSSPDAIAWRSALRSNDAAIALRTLMLSNGFLRVSSAM